MNPSEKVAYLKGLIEGMGIKADSNEGKIYAAVCDALAALAVEVEDLTDGVNELDEAIGAIDDDLADLEDYTYGDEDDDDYDDDDDEDEEYYDVTCPSCGNELTVGESIVMEGSMKCPNCGELLEFDADGECCCDDEDCGCCDCGCEDGKKKDK